MKEYTLACNGDKLTALIVCFHHYLSGFSNSADDFCFYFGHFPYYNGRTLYTVAVHSRNSLIISFTMIISTLAILRFGRTFAVVGYIS